MVSTWSVPAALVEDIASKCVWLTPNRKLTILIIEEHTEFRNFISEQSVKSLY